MIYFVNPRGKGKPFRRRKSKGRGIMARRKKRRIAGRSRSRAHRSRSHKRRPGVRLVRRGVTVYQGNPRRRHRYRRNPPILRQIQQQAIDAVATVGGSAASRIVSGFVPLPDGGLAGVAKGALVAVGLGLAARQFLPSDTARFVAAGAMETPIRQLITTLVPQAGAFLGAYDDGVAGYLSESQPPGTIGGYLEEVSGVGSYEQLGEYVSGY